MGPSAFKKTLLKRKTNETISLSEKKRNYKLM